MSACIVAEARRLTSLPLTAKIRLGTELDEEKLTSFCRMLEDEGIDMISIHARLKHESFARNPRWERIARVKERSYDPRYRQRRDLLSPGCKRVPAHIGRRRSDAWPRRGDPTMALCRDRPRRVRLRNRGTGSVSACCLWDICRSTEHAFPAGAPSGQAEAVHSIFCAELSIRTLPGIKGPVEHEPG